MAALGHHSFFVSDHGYDDVDFLGLVIGLQSESAGLPIVMSREAHNFILTSLTGSLLLDEGYFGPMF